MYQSRQGLSRYLVEQGARFARDGISASTRLLSSDCNLGGRLEYTIHPLTSLVWSFQQDGRGRAAKVKAGGTRGGKEP
jgi:hypothetical protein